MGDVAFPEWNNWVAAFLANFPIYIQHDRTRFTPIHKQPGAEIHIVCEGRANLLINSRSVQQRPRQVTIFDGGNPHQLISDDALPFSRIVVCINPAALAAWRPYGEAHPFDAFSTWTRTPAHFVLTEAEFSAVEGVCKALMRELYEKKLNWQHMLLARLTELTTLLQRSAALSRPRLASPAADERISDLTLTGARYVQEHLGEDLTLNKMAERLGVSPEHLTRTFKRDFQVSFYRYVMLLRMEEAKRLLWGPSPVTVADVAAAVGFKSLSHFSRTFQSLTGQTPSSFRQHKTWP